MGYASLVEDIIKRFDAESSFAPCLRSSKPPPPAAVAERLRREREEQATAIAIREFQKNQRKFEKQKTALAALKNRIAQYNRELRGLKAKASSMLQANKSLERDLAKYRSKYAHRALSQLSQASGPSDSSLSPLLTKIETFRESDLAALDRESRERFNAMKAYATSERRVQAQSAEIEALNLSLAGTTREVQTLREFVGNIERENRSLNEESKTFQGWDRMTEWLTKNPKFTPKELPPTEAPKPFNPLFPLDTE